MAKVSTNPRLLASLQLALKHPAVVHELLDAGAGRRRELLGGGVIHRSSVTAERVSRRDNERASRTSAVIAFADPGSGLSMSLTAIQLILRCTTTDSRPIELRHAGTVIPEGTGCVNRVADQWFCWLSASG